MKLVCDLAVTRVGKWLGRDGGGVLLGAAALLLLSLAIAGAQVPPMLNYQGRVQVGTNDFNGVGQFKFALVNANGSATYWSNDGTASGQPGAAVTLSVTQGLYSVLLGNTNLPGMAAVPPAAFAGGDVHLRVWFNDGVNGFQQFVPDQRIAAVAYAVNAGNAVTAGSLTGPISVDQLPPGIPRATNGTTTIAGNVVVQGTLMAAGVVPTGAPGSSGLPAGTTIEVLINNNVAPGVRFESLKDNYLKLSRATTDLSWPSVFLAGDGGGALTNPPVAVRINLPNGGKVIWNVAGAEAPGIGPSYSVAAFSRPIAGDGRPYDQVTLGDFMPGVVTRSNINVSVVGTSPVLPAGLTSSGQPALSSLRLSVDGVNYNNMVLQGAIEPTLWDHFRIFLNPSQHTALSDWALRDPKNPKSVEVLLINGLLGNVVTLGGVLAPPPKGVVVNSYEVRLASDGLPMEVITLVNTEND